MILFKHDIGKTWKIINSAINKHNDESRIEKITYNNVEIHDSVQIAYTFNQYFSQIGHSLAEDVPPTQKTFLDFIDQPNPNSLYFVPVHRNELIDIVHNLKNKKSSDPLLLLCINVSTFLFV